MDLEIEVDEVVAVALVAERLGVEEEAGERQEEVEEGSEQKEGRRP